MENCFDETRVSSGNAKTVFAPSSQASNTFNIVDDDPIDLAVEVDLMGNITRINDEPQLIIHKRKYS